MLHWRSAALASRIVYAAVALWALALILNLDQGQFSLDGFVFFTSLSNLACTVWAVVSLVVTVRDVRREGWRGASSPSPRVAGYVLMSILVTMLIYTIVLIPTVPPEERFTPEDTVVHVIVPILTLLDWLLFTPKGHQRWFDPLLWAVPPYLYLGWAFLHHALGGTFAGRDYPYPFMNVDEIGWGGFFLYVLVLTVALEIVAYLIHAVDRLLGRRVRRPAEALAT
ncbi:Pr6Pr family membrane protein [Protaetiibacter larvae]|uniref:Pr6Pr family membrane protein n=1 Tax=Protaetiibacter larvae TaxID=2592654 RepID=A0A5C1Y525_9MICO|nr:Pr6Pr family membrane protein [Protaetiibacter larvae]QEO08861.1 hypothetical protein FLP23_01800 [Protaetiibacter larvae]